MNAVAATAVRELLELIAVLHRRMPQVQRVGDASMARDAAALRARALRRIDEFEREQPGADEIGMTRTIAYAVLAR